ncbi:acyltransferase [Clostridium paraputrificum]|uniref:acyltransferase n=1 Tax=Clostridium paraputrificum TaxID=29363 RepID=UPI003D348221
MKGKINHEMNSLRTFAIFLVVLLHVNANNVMKLLTGTDLINSSEIVTFISIITRIGVPIFVMLSGRYLLASVKDYSLKEFYKKRVPRLILPLLAAVIIYFPFYMIGIEEATFLNYIKDIFTGFKSNPLCIHLWYIYMLLILYLLSPLFYKLLEGKSLKKSLTISIGLCVLGSIMEIIKNITGINIWIFWWIEFSGLFTLGYVLKDFKIKNKRWLFFAIALIVELVSTIWSIYLLNIGNDLWFFFHLGLVPNAQITTIMIYLFANSFEGKNSILSRISKYTLGIYLYHPLIIVTVVKIIDTGIIILNIFIGTVVAFLVPLVIMIFLYKIKPIRKFIS